MSLPGKDRLGRGLEALLGDYLETEPDASDIRRLRLTQIGPNPLQPRKEFPAAELAELAHSIKENGLLQPLVVRPVTGRPDRFELVVGERRLRAVTELHWHDVNVIVKEVDDETLLILALVENLQREALNPLEEAEGYRMLADSFGMTQAQIARSVGKDRSTVANLMRLLRLPPSIRKLIRAGKLSAGHARALIPIGDAVHIAELARRAVREGWSVREIERRVDEAGATKKRDRAKEAGGASARDPIIRVLEEALRERLATRVSIRVNGRGRGSVEIPFQDPEDFERVFALIAGREASDVVG